MLDCEDLCTFATIAEVKSFSRAADALGIAQSVASKRLKRLEDRLGARLIDRENWKQIRLTRVGELFLPEAMRSIQQMRRAESAGKNLARGVSGPLRIGFVFSAAINGLLTQLLRGLRRQLSELQFHPRLMETPEQISALEEGRLDLALLRPRLSYPEGCHAREIFSENLVACLSVEHRLASGCAAAPADFARERFIIPQFHERVGLIDNLRRFARAGGFPLPEIFTTADFVTAACLAAAGDGVVLAPASLRNMNIGGVKCIDLPTFAERLTTTLVWRSDAPAQAIRILDELFRATPAINHGRTRGYPINS